jgi:hypothetical protein
MKIEGQVLNLDIHSAAAHAIRYVKSRFVFQKAAQKIQRCTLREKSTFPTIKQKKHLVVDGKKCMMVLIYFTQLDWDVTHRPEGSTD